MKTFALLLLFIGKLIPGLSQINESDTVKFQLKSGLTGNYQTGNVNVLSLRGKIDFCYSFFRNKWVFKSQNSSLFQKINTVRVDNDIFSRNYFYFKPQNKVYPFLIAYISANYRRKIDFRYFAGSGITLQVIKTNKHGLKISGSAVYEETAFKETTFNYPEYNNKNKIQVWRGMLYASGRNYLLNGHLRLNYDFFWQPAFSDSKNYRTQADAGIEFPIWKGISVTALYTYAHENVVVTKIKQADKILTFGAVYNFKTSNK